MIMKSKHISVAAVVLMASACATTDIVPAGKDTFVMAGYNEFSSGPNIKTNLYKKANAHCSRMGKLLMPVNESFTSTSAELRFRCLYENDPEYVRPVMESVPDITIETN